MTIKAQMHTSDFLHDEDGASGESSMNANLYFEFDFITPSKQQLVREIISLHYREIRVELENALRLA